MAKLFESIQEEYEYRNKKFIPANIIAIILSAVALFSLLFMPILTVDLGQLLTMSMSDSMGGGEGEESVEESNDSKLMSRVMEDVISDSEVKLEITFFTVFDLINGKFDLDNMTSTIYEEGGMMEKMMLYSSAMMSFTKTVNLDSLTDADIGKVDLGNAVNAIYAAEQNETTARESYVNAIVDVATSLGATVDADQRASVSSDFDTLLDRGKPEGEDGKFTVEYLICSSMTEGECTTYEELQIYMDKQMSGGSGEEGEGAEMMEGMDVMLKYVGMGIVGIMGVGILCWALLLLFAFIGLFKKDKRFKIWYVVVFGVLPFLLFFVLFKVLGSVIGKIAGEVAAGILGGITSMTWIMGLCWGLLILVSIFYMLPKKHKIKKLEKEIKKQEQMAAQSFAENE